MFSAATELEALWSAPVGLAIFDRAFRYVRVNEALAAINGLPAAAHVGKTVRELFPALADVVEAQLARVRDGGRPEDVEVSGVPSAPAGELRDFRVSYFPIREGGAVAGVGATVVDITAQKATERALAEGGERYRALLASLDDGFCILEVLFDETGTRGVDSCIVEANPAFTRQAGLPHPAGKTMREVVPGVDASWAETFGRVVLTGESARFERHEPALGRWFEVQAMRLGAPERRRVAVLFRDVTARHQEEAALRQSEQEARRGERFAKRVIDSLFAFVAVLDRDGTLLETNAAPLTAAGIRIEDVRGLKFWDGYWWSHSEQVRAGVRDACARAARGEIVRYDVEARVAGDGRMAVDFQVAPLYDDAGTVTHLIPSGIDLTERKRMQAALEASEARLRRLFETNLLGILFWDLEGGVHDANDEFLRIVGYDRRDLEAGALDWANMTPAEHKEQDARAVEELRSTGKHAPLEKEYVRKDGQRVWVLVGSAMTGADRGVAFVLDISGQKQTEAAVRAANLRLEEADRRKDEFIAILAHELRNPLAPVRNAVHLLKRLGPQDARLERARDIIDRQVSHMARLIDDLLDVSRIARGKLALQKETCDIAAIARQTAEDYRASLEAAGLTELLAVPPAPLWVDGDPVRLAQMIGNLLNNAGRFTNAGGRIEVTAGLAPDAQSAQVTVADTGVGIEPGLLARLFDPFSQADQDLARSKGGLGLGLALTKGLAELHGGGIAVRSEGAGRGAAFTLRLPLAARGAARVADHAGDGRGAGLRILIVEDNRDAAETLGDLLALGGHEVKLAYDGGEGIAAARAFRPHVVISDLGLPGALDGYAVARALRTDPALRGVHLVALSGYANEEARGRSRDAGFDLHLAKPPDIAALERTLDAIGARRASVTTPRA